MPPSIDMRVSTVEADFKTLQRDVKAIRDDYYDGTNYLGIRTKVVIMWYLSGAILTALGSIFGWIAHGLSGG